MAGGPNSNCDNQECVNPNCTCDPCLCSNQRPCGYPERNCCQSELDSASLGSASSEMG
mgnify:CR=1 FL=1